jgi:hypothetical protein
MDLIDVQKEEIPSWVDDSQPIRNVYEDDNYQLETMSDWNVE